MLFLVYAKNNLTAAYCREKIFLHMAKWESVVLTGDSQEGLKSSIFK